jgi:hypothetical protein
MEGDAFGKRRLAFLIEQLVCFLDRRVKDPIANCVAISRLATVLARENEVVGVAPARGDLVLAQELNE